MEPEKQSEGILSLILHRKSVRRFKEGTVTKADLEIILRAAMAAPSARNQQPWEFVAITDRPTLDRLAEGLPYAKMLHQAAAAIVVCAVVAKAHDQLLEYAILDTSAATENLLLAVEALQLGAVWTAIYPRKERMDHTREVLHIPEAIVPLCAIPIGHPTGQDKPKDKYNPKNIHWETW